MPEKRAVATLDLWKTAHRALYCNLGEEPLVVAFALGFRAVPEITKHLRNNYGYNSLWISEHLVGMKRDRIHKVLGCDFFTARKMLNMRKNGHNVVLIVVHMAAPHTVVWRLKNEFPEAKVISMVYDAMDLWVPRNEASRWDDYKRAKGSNRAEYEALKEIVRGDYVDAIIYKDYGYDWPYMKMSQCPSLWIPATHREDLLQPLPNPMVPPRFCYIGTIMPRSTHDRPAGVFSDIFMNQIFSTVSQQGFEVHAYVMEPQEEVLEEYRKDFPPGSGIRLFRGTLLRTLLPRLCGRYRWGWMLYDYPDKVMLPLVEATLPTKLWTYLFLGIPPVVSAEMKATARFIKEHGCGVVINKSQIPHLHDILSVVPYKQLLTRVEETRKKFTLEAHIEPMAQLIKQVMEAPRKPIPPKPQWIDYEDDYIKRTFGFPNRVRAWQDSRGHFSPHEGPRTPPCEAQAEIRRRNLSEDLRACSRDR